MKWRCLKTDPPKGNEHCILIFPMNTDVGHWYQTSNPEYARVNGVKDGYTHWCEIVKAPTHDEWSEKCAKEEK